MPGETRVEDPDEALVRSAGRGDTGAAAALVRKHLPRMLGVARRMLADAHEAEDVAQEVFLRAWRQAPRWKPGGAKFETWMHRVALNLCYDRLRRRRERTDPDAGAGVPDPAASPGHAWLARQRAAGAASERGPAQRRETQRRKSAVAIPRRWLPARAGRRTLAGS